MYAERLLLGTVKPPLRALAVFATTAVFVGGSAFAQAPHSVYIHFIVACQRSVHANYPTPSLKSELEPNGIR